MDRAIDLLDAPYYHAGRSTDLAGVEVCAAFKNLCAIGVGSAAGVLEREGQSAKSASMHNVAAVRPSFGGAFVPRRTTGGEQTTVAGLAGADDLYVTSQGGRNARLD